MKFVEEERVEPVPESPAVINLIMKIYIFKIFCLAINKTKLAD